MTERSEPRCDHTGHPCGTDTWAIGHPCTCTSCAAWLATLAIGHYGDGSSYDIPKWPGAATGLREEVAALRADVAWLRAILHRQLRMPLDEGAVTIRATDELLARYECDHVLDDGRCLCCGHDVEYTHGDGTPL